ncbi:hypothetical protein ACFQZJ_18125 [Maribacter chungangensis]|uniref:Uncharacterized protein n=1 Tax=Maribacter chungangensis TaxID=1069117 RepID=A0ABW3B8B9_9FLAO
MTNKNPFKNQEFDDKINTVKNVIKNYLEENKFELKELSYDELIQWHDFSLKGPKIIYPSEKCPDEIKHIVQEFINKEFNNVE